MACIVTCYILWSRKQMISSRRILKEHLHMGGATACSNRKGSSPSVLAPFNYSLVSEPQTIIFISIPCNSYGRFHKTTVCSVTTHNFFQSRPRFPLEVNQQLIKEGKLGELPEHRKYRCLILDKMTMKENLVYNKYSG